MRRLTLRAYIYLAYFAILSFLFFIFTTNHLSGRLKFDEWTQTKNFVNIPVIPMKLKYILQWTSPKSVPFVYMGVGQEGFIRRNCTYTNCYVTSNRTFLFDYSEFDVILFAGPEVILYKEDQLPHSRFPHQKYVYATIESAFIYPICSNILNGFFNWTWTYKLDSDLRWGYMVIEDVRGNVVGPKKEMKWIEQKDMLPVSAALRVLLKRKTKLAAWFVSNCVTNSYREGFVEKLNQVLQTKYELRVDIYGECGNLKCPRDNETECFEILKKDYYFYLSFENSYSEDYVTEKLINAVKHYTVPVVYGGANYSRFLPNGSYLNAAELGPEILAEKMYQLMNNLSEYVDYFRWTNHYSYHRQSESSDTDEYCKMCELINDKERMETVSVYTDLRSWWDPPEVCYAGYGAGDPDPDSLSVLLLKLLRFANQVFIYVKEFIK